MSSRWVTALLVALVVVALAAGCAAEEKTQAASGFEGPHEDLPPGETARLRMGYEITVSNPVLAHSNDAPGPRMGLPTIALEETFTNNGSTPIGFGNRSCNMQIVDSGVHVAPTSTPETARQQKITGPDLEPGQTRNHREAYPLEGDPDRVRILCSPAYGSGATGVSDMPPPEATASWLIDLSTLD
jgi:hypothetical protein